MNGKQISIIYFYLVSAASLALLVVGLFSLANLTINLTQYNQYPLQYLAEDCQNFRMPVKEPYPILNQQSEASLSAEQRNNLEKDCQDRVERERKQRKLNDIKDTFMYLVVGSILFAIHFPQARKLSDK